MSSAEQPVEAKKKFGLKSAALVVCGLVGIVLGGVKMYQGVREIIGSGADPEIQRLLVESDKAVDDANKITAAAAPRFQELLSDVDSLGLDKFRKEKQDSAHQVSEQYGKAASTLRAAAQELDEAANRKVSDKLKPFLAAKSQVYRLAADACERNQEIVALLLDKSIVKMDDLLPKIEEVAARRDASQKASNEASAKADEMVKQAK